MPIVKAMAARLTLGGALALGSGCSSLQPLPPAEPAACARDVRSVSALWSCLAKSPIPDSEESGFKSTLRVVNGDLARKTQDQQPARACDGTVPVDFEKIQGIQTEAGRPPLHAFFRAPADGKPVVILVHGLYDSKFSRYIQVTAEGLARSGFGVLAPDMRWHGCLLSRDWPSTLGVEEGRDLLAWAHWLHKVKSPGHPVGLLGFSMGGLDVLHAAALESADRDLDAGVIAVCPPVALERLAANLDARSYFADHGWTKLIHSKFKAYLEARLTALSIPVKPSFLALLDWSARESHAPGPDPAAAFLESANPAASIRATRTPLLILAASNDPIIPDSSIFASKQVAQGQERVRVIETKYGGHLGQLGLYPHWFSEIAGTFFDAVPRISR
ncbi:MAG: alpha/beta fold hydrolase [Thermoanaerobaculia bacterium]